MQWSKPESTRATFWGNFAKEMGEDFSSLIGFTNIEFKEDHPCYQGELKDVVFAKAQVFDGPQKGEVYPRVQIEAAAVVNQLKEKAGKAVLGRIGKTASKKGTKYWTLDDPTDQDMELATEAAKVEKAPWED